MADVSIRQARESDLAGILDAYLQAGIGAGISFTVDEAREHFKRFAQYPNYRVFVAEIDERLVGTYALAVLDNLAKRGAPCGVVEDVAVLPATQGQGVGRAMMEHAREECRKAGCYKITLSSGMPREGAHRFYESLGFERHGYSFLIRP